MASGDVEVDMESGPFVLVVSEATMLAGALPVFLFPSLAIFWDIVGIVAPVKCMPYSLGGYFAKKLTSRGGMLSAADSATAAMVMLFMQIGEESKDDMVCSPTRTRNQKKTLRGDS